MVETFEAPPRTYQESFARHSVLGGLELTSVPALAQVNLRVDPKSPAAERIGTALGAMLPNQPGDVVRVGEYSVCWLGPDEWLIVGPEGTQDEIQDTVRTAAAVEHATVVDVSAHRGVVEVRGTRARELLNKGCALDLHPNRFGTNRCAETMLACAQVVLVCRDAALPSFWVFVRSSFARYLADWLLDAGAEWADPEQIFAPNSLPESRAGEALRSWRWGTWLGT